MADVGALIGSAVSAARLTQRELETRTGISQSTLNRIITGKRVAKMPEIVAIADATGHTVAQLTGLSTVADRVQCAARATNSSEMSEMRNALLHFLELNDYLADQAVPSDRPVSSGQAGPLSVTNAEKEGAVAAEEFRRDNRLGLQPIGDLITVIEQATGTDVAILDVGQDEHGMTMRDPRRNAVLIAVACTDRPMRQRSSLAHELAHIIFEDCADTDPDDWSQRSDGEKRADAFARHLLLPAEALQGVLGPAKAEPTSQAVLSDVVQRFLVSPKIASIAMEQAGYIDEGTKDHWFGTTTPKLATRYGWLDQYQALAADAGKRRAPQRLVTRAITGYELGVLPVQAIATLLDQDLASTGAVLQQAGIDSPAQPSIVWASARDLPDTDIDLSALDDELAADQDRADNDGWDEHA